MGILKRSFFQLIFLTTIYCLLTTSVLAAVTFSTSLPTELSTGLAVKGQEYDFTININTAGESISTVQARITYDAVNLQYVSATNGGFFTQITPTTPANGEFFITGTSATVQTGTGKFAVIRFKLLGVSGNSATLCSATAVTPSPTPTTGPSATPGPTNTPAPVVQACNLACSSDSQCSAGLACINGMCLRAACPAQTNCICPTIVAPTALPRTGSITGWKIGSLIALSLVGIGLVGMLIL
jgi:hypothetical protein